MESKAAARLLKTRSNPDTSFFKRVPLSSSSSSPLACTMEDVAIGITTKGSAGIAEIAPKIFPFVGL
jgi:hypothetical protein